MNIMRRSKEYLLLYKLPIPKFFDIMYHEFSNKIIVLFSNMRDLEKALSWMLKKPDF